MLSTLASDHRRLSSPIVTLEMGSSSPAMSSLPSSHSLPHAHSPMRTLTMFSRVSGHSLLLPGKRRRWLSDLHVFMGLLMSVVGAGMLSVPYTFVIIPTSQAVAGIVVVGISMGCTATALLHAHVQVASKEEQLRYVGTGRRFASFQAISRKAGGEIFALVVSVTTALGIFGGCVGGIRIVRDLTPHIAGLLLGSSSISTSEEHQTAEALLLWGSFVVVVLPLCLLKDLSALKITNYLGFVFSIYLVVAVGYRSLQTLSNNAVKSESGPVDASNLIHLSLNTSLHEDASTVMPFDNGSGADVGAMAAAINSLAEVELDPAPRGAPFLLFAQSVSIYNFAFMMHLNLLPLFVQLRGSFDRPVRETRNRMAMGIATVSGFCIALYLALGVCGAKLYGTSINGNMLLNLAADPGMQIPLVALYVIVIVTFPLLFHPMRRILEELLVKGSTPICFLQRFVLTVVLLGAALLIAMQVPGIEVVFSLLGATTCMLICFVFPVVIFTRVYPWPQRALTKLCTCVLWLIVAIEVVIGIVAVYSIFERTQ